MTKEEEVVAPKPVHEFDTGKYFKCDSCSARANVRFVKESTDLVFCMHHSRKHFIGLVAGGWYSTNTDWLDYGGTPR